MSKYEDSLDEGSFSIEIRNITNDKQYSSVLWRKIQISWAQASCLQSKKTKKATFGNFMSIVRPNIL